MIEKNDLSAVLRRTDNLLSLVVKAMKDEKDKKDKKKKERRAREPGGGGSMEHCEERSPQPCAGYPRRKR